MLSMLVLSVVTGSWAGKGKASSGKSTCRAESSERGTGRWVAVYRGC